MPVNTFPDLDGVFLFNVGVDCKAFLASRKVFLTPYIIFGAAYNHMWWNYENPVITSDGEKIHGDDLGGGELHLGLGLHVAQTKKFRSGPKYFLPSYTGRTRQDRVSRTMFLTASVS